MIHKIKTLQPSGNSMQGTSNNFQLMTPILGRHNVNNNSAGNAGTESPKVFRRWLPAFNAAKHVVEPMEQDRISVIQVGGAKV